MGSHTKLVAYYFVLSRNTKINTMNPMVCVLGLLGASATMAAPVPEPEAGWAAAAPAVAGLGYAAAPAAGLGLAGVGYAGIAAAPAVAAAPVAAVAAAPVNIPAPAISVPAPYSTQHVSGPDAVSVHQPPPVVTKKIEDGTRPYEVLKHVTKHVDVPTPVHVDAPYNVPVPTPVHGEPIIQRVTGPARVVHSHENRIAPAVHTGAVYGGAYAHGIGAAPVAAVGAVGA